jgi:hypothetical protein
MSQEQSTIEPEPDALDILALTPLLAALATIDEKSPAPDTGQGLD